MQCSFDNKETHPKCCYHEEDTAKELEHTPHLWGSTRCKNHALTLCRILISPRSRYNNRQLRTGAIGATGARERALERELACLCSACSLLLWHAPLWWVKTANDSAKLILWQDGLLANTTACSAPPLAQTYTNVKSSFSEKGLNKMLFLRKVNYYLMWGLQQSWM